MLYRLSYVRAGFRLAHQDSLSAAERRGNKSLLRGIAKSPLEDDDQTMRGLHDWRREDGQTMAEYGVILAVITPAIVAAIALLAFSVADNILAVVGFLS
jgi:Flp pilus assembly pilin Flp